MKKKKQLHPYIYFKIFNIFFPLANQKANICNLSSLHINIYLPPCKKKKKKKVYAFHQ